VSRRAQWLSGQERDALEVAHDELVLALEIVEAEHPVLRERFGVGRRGRDEAEVVGVAAGEGDGVSSIHGARRGWTATHMSRSTLARTAPSLRSSSPPTLLLASATPGCALTHSTRAFGRRAWSVVEARDEKVLLRGAGMPCWPCGGRVERGAGSRWSGVERGERRPQGEGCGSPRAWCSSRQQAALAPQTAECAERRGEREALPLHPMRPRKSQGRSHALVRLHRL